MELNFFSADLAFAVVAGPNHPSASSSSLKTM